MIVALTDWYPSMARRWATSSRRYPIASSERRGWTVHHTAGGDTADEFAYARDVADMHYRRWQRPGGYNFLIGRRGTIFEMCGFGFVGAHAPGGNRASWGVSFQGTFTVALPSADQAAAFTRLVHAAPRLLTRQWGHRDWSDTACPGDLLYRRIPLPTATPPPSPVPALPDDPETIFMQSRICGVATNANGNGGTSGRPNATAHPTDPNGGPNLRYLLEPDGRVGWRFRVVPSPAVAVAVAGEGWNAATVWFTPDQARRVPVLR